MAYKLFVTAVLFTSIGAILQASNQHPKPLPSPPMAAIGWWSPEITASPKPAATPDTEVEYLRQTGKGRTPQLPKGKFPFIAVDNGTVQLTIADGDMPVGPCDLGKLVRAARRLANLDRVASPSFRETLLAEMEVELARCSPKPEPGR